MRDLEEPMSMVSLVETHDRRTIAAAEKQGLIMVYVPQMVMRTESGAAYLLLETDEYGRGADAWSPL